MLHNNIHTHEKKKEKLLNNRHTIILLGKFLKSPTAKHIPHNIGAQHMRMYNIQFF